MGDLITVLVLEEMDSGKPAPVTCLGSLGNLRVRGKAGIGARDLGRAGRGVGEQAGEEVRRWKEALCSLSSRDLSVSPVWRLGAFATVFFSPTYAVQ